MTIWKKYTSTSDKIFSALGNKYLSTSLLGEKYLNPNLLGKSDLRVILTGNSIISFDVDSDKIVSLTGNTLVSLTGTKHVSALIGELSTTHLLYGDASYSNFAIYWDTTYVTTDFTDITCDNR